MIRLLLSLELPVRQTRIVRPAFLTKLPRPLLRNKAICASLEFVETLPRLLSGPRGQVCTAGPMANRVPQTHGEPLRSALGDRRPTLLRGLPVPTESSADRIPREGHERAGFLIFSIYASQRACLQNLGLLLRTCDRGRTSRHP